MGDLLIGLKNFYYADLLTDDIGVAPTYGTPVYISPAVMMKAASKASSATFYGDDAALAVATTEGESDVEFETKDWPLTIQAHLLGRTITGGVMEESSTDAAPYVAIGYEATKANGKKRLVWFYKGKFLTPDDEHKTKADKVEFQTAKLKAVFVNRTYDGKKRKIADTEEIGFVAATETNWFLAVQGTPDVTAPTVSSIVPANAATGIAVGAAVVWTFSEAINWLGAADAAGKFSLIADVAGTTVAGVLSINTLRTIVTFTPTANLTAATAYRAIANVGIEDLAGNNLATNSVTKFTTA